MDVHGCYIKGQPFLGAPGGQIQQWYHVIAAIKKLFCDQDMRSYYERVKADPSNVRATTPSELVKDCHLVPFLLSYIKELKPAAIQLCNTPQLQRLVETFSVPVPAAGDGYDLSKISKEQYLQFRNVFVENCMCNDTYADNKD